MKFIITSDITHGNGAGRQPSLYNQYVNVMGVCHGSSDFGGDEVKWLREAENKAAEHKLSLQLRQKCASVLIYGVSTRSTSMSLAGNLSHVVRVMKIGSSKQ